MKKIKLLFILLVICFHFSYIGWTTSKHTHKNYNNVKVKLTVQSASTRRSGDAWSKPDLYVKIKRDWKLIICTPYQQGSYRAYWNLSKTLKFKKQMYINVTLYDKDVSNDDKLYVWSIDLVKEMDKNGNVILSSKYDTVKLKVSFIISTTI